MLKNTKKLISETNLFQIVLLVLILFSCGNVDEKERIKINYLDDYEARDESGLVNAIIEIPAGTLDKWEVNKKNGRLEWEYENNKPRVVQYLGYPGNYGMIPGTYLPKDKGGDGDPLDIIVLGPPAERGTVLKCKVVGILYLEDRGEKDDKLIGVSQDSPFYAKNEINQIDDEFPGIKRILETWFSNYKGEGKIKSGGFGSQAEANQILNDCIQSYQNSKKADM